MSNCDLCGNGYRNKINHCYSYRHKKQLIKLFKLFNKKKEERSPDDYEKIYDECLTEIITSVRK